MGKRCICPRCGDWTYEILLTHSHCAGCFYSPDFEVRFEPPIPKWAERFAPKDSEISLEAFLAERNSKIVVELPLHIAPQLTELKTAVGM